MITRKPPLTKLMTTNWAKRSFLTGVAGSAWCAAWIVYDWATMGGWPRVAMVAFFYVLLWVNARNLRSNWRGWRAWQADNGDWLEKRQEFRARMARLGVPKPVIEQADELLLAGRLEDGWALIQDALDDAGRN